MMRRISLTFAIMTLLMASCRQQSSFEGFTVEGGISGAEGETLYLDRLGINEVQAVDSVKLDAAGAFSFSQPRPECFDFYRLRLKDKFVNLAVDSTETISVKADASSMTTGYEVTGSEDSESLKQLTLRQMRIQKEIDDMVASSGPETGILAQKVGEKVDVFKSEITTQYILNNPGSPCAYYALFMRINGTSLFRPQLDRQDAKIFAAVATAMDLYYPEALRTINIHNAALKGMKATAKPREMTEDEAERLNGLVSEAGVIDIALPDVSGTVKRLSDLKGKVVLLDFTSFGADYSVEYVMMLRELYDKYADQGFEIYQVSVDQDAHFWAVSSDKLPWICVRDEKSLASQYLLSYSVTTLPTAFLINRDNEITERMQDFRDLDSHISNLLN